MHSFTFQRDQRLLRAPEFNKVFAQAQLKTQSGVFLLLAYRSDALKARLGLVVGKKHAKRAVIRNQIRRILRESFRHHQQDLVGLDLVVLARAKITEVSKQHLRTAVDAMWHQLKPNTRSRQKPVTAKCAK